MSGITFADMCMAQTEEERIEARNAHHEAVKNAPTDAEIVKAFLLECTTTDGQPVELGSAA